MEKEVSQMSLIELAEYNLSKKKNPQTFQAMFKEIAEIKNLSDDVLEDVEAQFYTELVISAKFIYCGEDLWDLKSRQKIDNLDKEFYGEHKDILDADDEEFETYEDEDDYFNDEYDEVEDEERDDDEIDDIDDVDDDIDDEIDDEDDIDIIDEEVGLPIYEEDDDFEEDKYNDIMDDYEDLYE